MRAGERTLAAWRVARCAASAAPPAPAGEDARAAPGAARARSGVWERGGERRATGCASRAGDAAPSERRRASRAAPAASASAARSRALRSCFMCGRACAVSWTRGGPEREGGREFPPPHPYCCPYPCPYCTLTCSSSTSARSVSSSHGVSSSGSHPSRTAAAATGPSASACRRGQTKFNGSNYR
jgi:hypothetical protein